MSSRGMGDIPLAAKNRLGYIPPGFHRSNHVVEVEPITPNTFPTEAREGPPESAKKLNSESIFALISTTYSLLIVAFFKSLLDRMRKVSATAPARSPPHEIVGTGLRSEEPLDFASESGFPGESTPLNNSVIIDNADGLAHVFPAQNNPRSAPSNLNLYASILELDSDPEDDLDMRDQYGTSLKISEASSYKPYTQMERAPANVADITAAELLDTEFPVMDDYDKEIHKFYAPLQPVPQPKYSLTDAMLAAIPSYEFSSFLRKERERIQSLIFQERKESLSRISPLNKAQLDVVNNVWRSRALNQPVVSEFCIDVTVKDIKTLADSSWLNDNIIDFYLNMVSARSSNIFCWTTHFFSTLKSKGYPGVARWAKRKKVNLLEKDLVIVPINIMGTHWALAVVDNQAKSIGYYDSLSSRGNIRALESLNEYMLKESERLQVPSISYTLHPNMKTPQQQNGFDCGVFTCTVAKYISERLPLSFGQKDMQLIRRRMAYEIINKTLLGDAPQSHL
ncbi:hypothetical protein JCM33374_g6101 [Metschnikowia sp. JCM 33374]|nr:hypothetical protein JCM33374_g6101 [Metschnikowia sp. JCM 33374]